MNYRHAYHAGNFADVHKHAALALILRHLGEKDAAFRVLDTHAGAGVYDLAAAEATQTGEWRAGIGRLLAAPLAPDVAALLTPYLDGVASCNSGEGLRRYPGSPALALHLLRPHDRLIACEILPEAERALAALFGRDKRAKALSIDGWTALGAFLPPKERRGLVVIDPPYENPQEFARVAEAFAAAHRKWPTGIYLIWYPVTGRAQAEALTAQLTRLRIPKILRAELGLGPESEGLRGSGLAVVNPPWRLHDQLAVLLPALAEIFAPHGSGSVRLDWLAGA